MPGAAEVVVEAAAAVVATTRSTTITNTHPPALLRPTVSTLKVKQEKDLLTAEEVVMDATHTDMDMEAHEALDIMAGDEEDGVVAEA